MRGTPSVPTHIGGHGAQGPSGMAQATAERRPEGVLDGPEHRGKPPSRASFPQAGGGLQEEGLFF